MIVHLVKQDFGAPYNVTAKHAAMITGEKVSANLVKGIRRRNGLQKETKSKGPFKPIRTSYGHVVSVDVVREDGVRIFGFIQDKTKAVYHHLAEEQTSREALNGLKKYISLYGRPDAVRSDHGKEFHGEFEGFLKLEGIKHIMPLPYNPKANGFIERYFRTLRKTLFRRLKSRSKRITQTILDDFAFLWNHCRQASTKDGKTPAELLGLGFPPEMLERFRFEKQTIGRWTFWHIQGVYGLLHAYLRIETLQIEEQNRAKKIA
ncbi:MAG: transposase family protein [Proteobacteria bacterium]|nr:transposase family protein [Pseudomonadota bacterium]